MALCSAYLTTNPVDAAPVRVPLSYSTWLKRDSCGSEQSTRVTSGNSDLRGFPGTAAKTYTSLTVYVSILALLYSAGSKIKKKSSIKYTALEKPQLHTDASGLHRV